MTDTTHAPEERPTIGPVASTLLYEDDQVLIWHMDVEPGGTFWNHYHNHDYVLLYTSTWVGAVYDATAEHDATWRARSEGTDEIPQEVLGTRLQAQSIHYIPGTGFLSPGFANVGTTPFTGGLVELKHPAPPEAAPAGYAASDALVGMAPRPGTVSMLENDRVKITQTTLEPGASDELRPRLGAGVYVISGSRLLITEEGGSGQRTTREEERPSPGGLWAPAGTRQLTNVGDWPYRELAVEVK